MSIKHEVTSRPEWTDLFGDGTRGAHVMIAFIVVAISYVIYYASIILSLE